MRHLRLHQLTGDRQGQWALDLTERWRLVVGVPAPDTVMIEEVSQHYGD